MRRRGRAVSAGRTSSPASSPSTLRSAESAAVACIGQSPVGQGADFDIKVRRVGPDFAERWIWTLDHSGLEDQGSSVAVGASEAIFVADVIDWAPPASDIFGARLAPDGVLLWTHTHDHPGADLIDVANAAAFGTDFVVVAGRVEMPSKSANVWVRRLAAD